MLKIVYRDETLVVINKPAGMLVHRTRLDYGETVFAVQRLRDQIGLKVHPVHRLDKPTSGLLLFALNVEALKDLQTQFTERKVEKMYWAVVRGYLSEDGTLDYPLKREVDPYSQSTTEVNQNAITHHRCLAQTELPTPVGRYPTTRYSFIELKPETGRKHQLRRHMAHLRHPIVGDTRHGDGVHNRFFRERWGIHRLLLHAQQLSFNHPTSGDRISLTAELDEAFQDALEKTNLVSPE
ncbi:MAG: tRNA pseudouridine(65) synthase TruC [Opitutales bacterium]|nr:tRNA pseudouridine(65) synthase TruC [Opitutales bacterium]MDG2169188.1 tRNA pseudouridine(65) synthase TruC [Opitutales bacterium]